jgi:hypothetical protein
MKKAIGIAVVLFVLPQPCKAFTASEFIEAAKETVQTVCRADPQCVRRTYSVLKYLYDNPDLQLEFAKCGIWQLSKRGYIWSPLDSLQNMSKNEAVSFVEDTCTCTLGFWAEKICQGQLSAINEKIGKPGKDE